MAKPALYSEKRHRAIIEEYYSLQKEFYDQNPKLKGFIYPDFFYIETSNKVNLSPKYIRKLVRKYIKNSHKESVPNECRRNYI
jgi:hypothetical protein